MRIVLDLDGVIADFTKLACHIHGYQLNGNKLINYETREERIWPNGYWETYKVLGLSSEKEFWKPLREDNFWSKLDFHSDGLEILNICEMAVGRQNVVICTKPNIDPGSVSGKIKWIQKNLPNYSRRFLIGPPKHFLANKDTILVDDSDKNCNEFMRHGGNFILVPRLWNSNYEFNTIDYIYKQIRYIF